MSSAPLERPTVEFDHHAPELGRHTPWAVYAALRQQCPVGWSEAWDGFWVVSTYEAVRQVTLNDATFSSGSGVSLPQFAAMRPMLPIETDPPLLWKYRQTLNPYFSPGVVKTMYDELRLLANQLIDEFIERGEANLIDDLAGPLPAITTLRILGLDASRWREFRHWTDGALQSAASDIDTAVEMAINIYVELAHLIDDRRENGLRDDLVSSLIATEYEGETFSDEEIMDIGFLALFGGLDTTTGVTSAAMAHLGRHEVAKQRLIAEPELMSSAIEEFLRHASPVQGLARTVARDTDFEGCPMRKGEKVWVLWGSANRDPAEFDRPDDVVLDRHPNRHMAFGVGTHRCLGSNLGRAMFRIMLEESLRRFPDFRVPEGVELEHFDDVSVVYALRSLPIEFTPGVRETSGLQP